MWKVKNFGENIANVVFKYTEGELKIREATNDEPWGPHGALLHEITQLSFLQEEFDSMMEMLFSRLRDNENNWRRVYKGLLVLDYIIKNGSPRIIDYWRGRIHILRKIERTKYVDEEGKDQSVNVSHRSSEIISLLNDENRLRIERDKARSSSKRMISMQGSNSDYFPKNDQGRDMGRNIKDSIKGMMSTVVDKIQNSIRASSKDYPDDLQDEFNTYRFNDHHYNDDFDETFRDQFRYQDHVDGNAQRNFSGYGMIDRTTADDFGNFVGDAIQNKSDINAIRDDLFSSCSLQTQNTALNQTSDLINFDDGKVETSNLESIFSSNTYNKFPSGSANTANQFQGQSSYVQMNNQSNLSDLFQTSPLMNNGQQKQSGFNLSLDMQKQSSYFSSNHQHSYNSPMMTNNGSPMTSTFVSGFPQSSTVNNPSSLSSIGNNPPKQSPQISSVDDMIRESLESFSKPGRESRQLYNQNNSTAFRSTPSNQFGSFT